MNPRGCRPKYDHLKIKEYILENKKPIAIMLVVGCSYSVIRYVRNHMKKRKGVL
jgi:hypothetical protein